MAAVPLPLMPAGISAEWLTDVLRAQNVVTPNVAVTHVDVQPIAEGVGMMAEISRLQLSFSEQGAGPERLIAKYPSQNPTNREIAMLYNLYQREVGYYAELDSRTTARCPECHLAQLDGENFVLLLDDFGDYRDGDQTVGATLQETEAAIDELAKLHAPFWNNVADLSWVPHFSNSYHATNMHTLAHSGWDNMAKVFADVLPEHILAMKDDFLNSIQPLQTLMDSAPVTLCHGDFRMANLLYATADDHFPVAIIDWQGPLLGRGMFDVALMLGQSTQTEVRRAHEKSLLQRYLDGLGALGVDYAFHTAWDDYVHTQAYNWTYAAVVSGTLDASDERAFAWMSQMLARQVATTDDLRLAEIFPYS